MPRFMTDASFDTFHIISVSFHLQYLGFYFSDNAFLPSLLQPEGKELLFERQEDTQALLSFSSKHLQTLCTKKACSLEGVRN